MNNQVKLIDQTKLLEWLEDQKENSTMLYESIILSKIERAVLDGKFDTPPVPTIKPGDTVRHVGVGTVGKVAQVTEVGAFVHWSTGQRSWYPYNYLEVVE